MEGYQYNILLIEDDLNHQELIKISLEKLSTVKLIIKDKLDDAFSSIKKDPIDLVISDVRLPDGDAIEYYKRDNLFKDYFIILMTSFGDEKRAVEAMKSGALDYVVKDENTLLNMHRIIERALREISVIKEKEQALTALKESEDKYRQLVERSNDIPFVINKHGTVTYVGPQVQKYGYKLYQIIGKKFFDIVFYEDRERVNYQFQQTLTTFKENPVTFRIETPAKGIIWVEESSKFIFDNENELIIATGLLRDVTERIKVQNELKESEEKFRTFFESAYDAIFIMDEDKYIECNQRTLEIFGLTEFEEILGKTPVDFSPQTQPNGNESKSTVYNLLSKALNNEKLRFQWTHMKKDGTLFETEVSLVSFKLKQKSYIQAIVRAL